MGSLTLSPKRKAIDIDQCGSKRQKTIEEEQPPQQLTLAVPEPRRHTLALPAPPFVIKLKDEYVEPEYEELVRLTLSTGSSYPSPPERLPPLPLPESPPHPSLLQLMPPSSSFSSHSLQPSPESLSHLSFSQLLAQFPSPPGFPVLPQPPSLSLFMPSYSSQYIKPPPGLLFQPELPASQQPSPPYQQKQKPPAEEPAAAQKQKAPAEEPTAAQNQKPPAEEPTADEKQERRKQKQPAEGQARSRRPRNYKKPGWTLTIEAQYPWATSTRAKVLSMEKLLSQNITKIKGDLNCKECKKKFEIEYDLQSKFSEVVSFIAENLEDMHDRAPMVWLKPTDLDCQYCKKSKCVQPFLPKHKKAVNWLFLFLGQLIGYCNLTHLKYFCKHTNLHKTAAKDRLVYLAYTTLHLQLDPKAAATLYEKEDKKSKKRDEDKRKSSAVRNL